MPDRMRFKESLVAEREAEPAAVPVVLKGSLLIDLAQVFARHESQHVLVQDDDGRLIGIVSSDNFQQAIRDYDDVAATWHHRVVESLISIPLEIKELKGRTKPRETRQRVVNCIEVREGSDLIALLTNEDVLLSWNRIEPAIEQAAIDTLTSLPNRAHFERRFEQEWQRAERLGLTLGVLIIDVDNFKQINDSFGHLRGDLVLAAVAECCQKQLRSYDVIARFAGDEFVALTCGCSVDDIDLPIRRLLDATRTLNLHFDNEAITTSLSIGAAVVCRGLDHLRPDDLLNAADQCLYTAKETGRDRAYRVELFGDGSVNSATRVDSGAAKPV
ncbi:MAG: diguanylate cyclase [Planctomycetota bacterium]